MNARTLATLVLSAATLAHAQVHGVVCVTDVQGRPLPGVSLIATQAGVEGLRRLSRPIAWTDEHGCAVIQIPQEDASGEFAHPWFAMLTGFAETRFAAPKPNGQIEVVLKPATVEQSVTVTADRGLVGVDDQATSVAVLNSAQLVAPPALGLDDRLHQVAGFQLFRRTSSWTANPTTEGVSLRGLGSTAASRTLVVSDQVPLNDPFGGWIHWDEIPVLAIADVQLERGGAADLYGSSAIGGVIDIDPVMPVRAPVVRVAADTLGATENTGSGDLLVTAALRSLEVLLAGSGVASGGYIPTAPAFRGSVDVPATLAEESGRLELRRSAHGGDDAMFLRGNVLNEERGNGTPDQTNGTRLWRYLGGGDVSSSSGHASLRVFGDRETYRQSFSLIAADRDAESLTRLQAVPTDELGFSLTGSRAFAHALVVGLGMDLRDVRATDGESPVSGGEVTSTVSTSAHQRDVGGYAEGIWAPGRWSLSASVRVDSFRTFDGRQSTTSSSAVIAEPEISEIVASPHLGVVRNLPHGFALTATAFRAFRGPTMNELYRTGQVGQQITLANPNLLAERATGFEFGGEFASLRARGRELGRLRASYFWTEVNRPISAVLLSQTATAQTLQRQNLGQIRSRGLSVEAGTARWHSFDASFGYQLAVATVTAFNASSPVQVNLTGNWIPEVPREALTGAVNLYLARIANMHLIASYTGREFDDANNQFLLHPYPRFDASADRVLFHGLSVYAAAQNLADRSIDAGRTPVLTLAAPRLVQGGLRYSFAR